jgi:EmrB/QacA subfamily drug resistance transporter
MAAEPGTAPAKTGGGMDGHIWRVATVVVLGSIMSVLDTTIVNVALESLSRDLHTSLSDVQWVVTAYLLSLAAVVPMSAWAARRFGAKQVYLVSIVLFTLGSALCGLATSTTELVIFRVIQGIGGGMVMPLGQMILVRASGPRRLARVMGAISVVIVLAPVMGPTIGGLLLDNVGWRWIFYVNVPIGIAALWTGLRKLPADAEEDAGPFDLLGLSLVATGLIAITYGLAEIGASGGNGATHVALPLIGGVLLVAAFVVRALRIEHPLLDVRLYANRAFSAASLTTFCLGVALFGGMILMPLYFQSVRHQDAVYTGLLLAPRGVGAAIASWVAGRMTDRVGAGITAAVGGLVTLVFSIPFVMLGAHTSYVVISAAMLLSGFGIGLSIMPAFTAAYRALRPSQIGDAAPQLNILMRVGGSIGTAILTVVLQNHLTRAGPSLAAQASAFGSTFWWVLAVTAAAVIPTSVLIVTERRVARQDDADQADHLELAEARHMVEVG